jgi:hypothetical protein
MPPTTSTWPRCWPAKTAPGPRLWNDYYRIGEACRAAEHRFGLRRTAPRDRTAAHRPTRAESEKARRRGRGEPPRVTLRRAVATAAAASGSEREFFAHLDAAGVSVRKRFSTRNPGEVTGYAVALPADTARSRGPVWYGGGKLAPDLTLPKLRHRWAPSASDAKRITPAERNAAYQHAVRAAHDAAQQIRHFVATDPGVAADAAWAAADTLHATASALGNQELRRAADAYERAARCAYGRLPRPTRAGNRLRTAARILSAVAITTGDPLIPSSGSSSSSRPWPRQSSICEPPSSIPPKPMPPGPPPSDCTPRGAPTRHRPS